MVTSGGWLEGVVTDRALIEKREFTRTVTLAPGEAVEFTENIDNIVIPRRNDRTSGTNFEIVVGFVLDKQQMLYNRNGESLKFPEL